MQLFPSKFMIMHKCAVLTMQWLISSNSFSQLPEHWVSEITPQGRSYFRNQVTNDISWDTQSVLQGTQTSSNSVRIFVFLFTCHREPKILLKYMLSRSLMHHPIHPQEMPLWVAFQMLLHHHRDHNHARQWHEERL
jgi:hypothetical protein